MTRLTYTGGDGTEYELRDQANAGKPFFNASNDNAANCNSTPPLSRGNVWITADGSAATYVADLPLSDGAAVGVSDPGTESFDGPGPSGGVLAFRSGVMYHFTNSNVDKIIDRNGNRITLTYGLTSTPWRVTQAEDALGRKVDFAYAKSDATGVYDEITFDGAEGQKRQIRVRYSDLQDALSPTVVGCGAMKSTRTFDCLFPQPELNGHLSPANRPTNPLEVNFQVVRAVELPDGRQYAFKYNEYRELVSITLPTGGVIEYTHGPGAGASASGIVVKGSTRMVYRRVLERRVKADGSNVEGKTMFSESGESNPTVVTASQTSADGTGVFARQKHYFYGHPNMITAPAYGYSWWKIGREYKTEEGKDNGAAFVPTRTTDHVWEQRLPCPSWYPLDSSPRCDASNVSQQTLDGSPAVDSRIKETTITWNGTAEATRQAFTYDQFNNKTSIKDYNFNNALLRETAIDYEASASYVNPPSGKTTPPSAAHLRNLVKKQTVKDGAAATISQTEFYYDDSAPAGKTPDALGNYGSISGHDSGWSDSYRRRGNPSWIASWITGSEWSYSAYQHDIAGNAIKIKHPTVNRAAAEQITNAETTISYADSFEGTLLPATPTYGFPTTTTRTGQPASHITTAKYDYGTGKPKSFTDANLKTTSFSYSVDPLDRLKKVTRPIGTIEFAYDSTAGNNQVTTSASKSDGTNEKVTTTVSFDGLGREKRSVQVGGGTVDRQYDALGRLWRVSPPESGTPSHWTETTFDELNRPVRVVRPDGVSQALTYYSGKTTTSRDEGSKWRRTEVDGLGRLVSVTEDPTFTGVNVLGVDYTNVSAFSPLYQTTYTYDANGNLKTVTQGDRNRSFDYDGLSRLTSATNPETGSTTPITYEYDLSGNVTKKTDGRFSTSYRYDGMSRIKLRSYTDTNTPAVSYCYDGDTSANTNGADCTGAPTDADPKSKNMLGATTMVKNSHATVTYGSFDAMGRPLSSSQTVADVTGAYTFSYAYNDIGMSQMTPPSLRKLNYDYDIAGRPYQVRTDGAAAVPFATVTQFAPHGAPLQTTLGNGTGALTHTISYNSLLQQTGMSVVKAAASSVPLLTLGYQYCLNGSCTVSNGNNGNMVQQTISHSAPGEAVLNLTWDFTYDRVNRLLDFKENNTTVETNQYDRYGNRWLSAGVVAGKGMPSGSDWFSANNNRMTNVTYDASGNQVQFGSMTLTYDAENRIRAMSWDESATYFYDGAGRRVKKLTCTAPGPCLETTSGVKRTVFVYSADGQLEAEYQSGATASGLEYYVPDHLGTTRAIFGSNGDVQQRYDYRPFGWEIGAGVNARSAKYSASSYPGAGDGKTVKFTGKERDAETGLDYFEARYMSSAQGRFTSADPLGGWADDPQSWNKYAYGRNNPLLYTDPSGMRYTICDTSGNCHEDYSDADFDKNLSGTSKNGVIYDNDGNQIGTYQRTSFDDLSPMGNMFFNEMSNRRQASNQMIAAVGAGSAAAGVAGGVATATGTVAAVIDGVAYTAEQLAALGPVVLARLVAAGKLSIEAIQRLAAQVPQVANQVYLRLFAQSNNTTIPQGWLNGNNYFRIGEGFAPGGPVFRIAIGSKHVPLPSWVPGLYKGTLHINLWRR
ncbi:MAG: RHS repeat-associated core domain-containing protein [Bryobacteraceae bacterium]